MTFTPAVGSGQMYPSLVAPNVQAEELVQANSLTKEMVQAVVKQMAESMIEGMTWTKIDSFLEESTVNKFHAETDNPTQTAAFVVPPFPVPIRWGWELRGHDSFIWVRDRVCRWKSSFTSHKKATDALKDMNRTTPLKKDKYGDRRRVCIAFWRVGDDITDNLDDSNRYISEGLLGLGLNL